MNNVKKQERAARLVTWMVYRSSRNKSLLDKLCRWYVVKQTAVAPEDDFLRDPWIDNDMGYDPEELDRYQKGG